MNTKNIVEKPSKKAKGSQMMDLSESSELLNEAAQESTILIQNVKDLFRRTLKSSYLELRFNMTSFGKALGVKQPYLTLLFSEEGVEKIHFDRYLVALLDSGSQLTTSLEKNNSITIKDANRAIFGKRLLNISISGEDDFDREESVNNLLNMKKEIIGLINRTAKDDRIKQRELALILGVKQPRISDLSRGCVEKFTTDMLISFLYKMGFIVKYVERDTSCILKFVRKDKSLATRYQKILGGK